MSPKHSFNLLTQLVVTIFQCRGDCKTATTNSINKLVGLCRKNINISFIINISQVGNLVGNIEVK